MSATAKNPILFFLEDFHRGSVNVLLHFVGFLTLGYGLAARNLSLISLATFIMESGHFYNALRGRLRDYALWAIPLQFFLWLLIILTASLLLKFIETQPLGL